jgi:hypothetical protein
VPTGAKYGWNESPSFKSKGMKVYIPNGLKWYSD